MTNMIHLLYTITIKSHVSFARLPEKYPSPLLFSMPLPPPIIIKQDRKFSFDDWIQNLAHFLNNLI